MRMRDETNYAEYNKKRCSRVAYSRAQHSSEKTTPSSASTSARQCAVRARGLFGTSLCFADFHDLVSGARYLDKQH
jgi:hypothetical protein